MEQKTSIASGIEVTQDKSDYDAACKRLLSEKIILAWILKTCVTEFRDFDVKEIAEKYIEGEPFVSTVPVAPDETAPVIEGLNTALTSPTEGSVFFDIYFKAIVPGTKEVVQLIINVEAQGKFNPGYPLPKRGIFYCGRMISSQAGFVFTNSEYDKLRKVYSIWICTKPPKGRENTITRYRMCEENIIGKDHEPIENYDLISLVMIHLGNKEEKGNEGLLRLLSILLSSETTVDEKKQVLEDEFQIPMTQSMDKEVSLLCNLSQDIEDRGIQKGYEEGVLTSLKLLIKNTGWSPEKAMTTLEIPQSQRDTYSKLVVQ